VRLEELKRAKDERPFRPFVIRMADGKEVRVTHPDALAWAVDEADEDNGEVEEPDIVFCVIPSGNRIVIDLALDTSLEQAPVEPKGKAKKKGKGKGKGGSK
jgi:hypothetical protein